MEKSNKIKMVFFGIMSCLVIACLILFVFFTNWIILFIVLGLMLILYLGMHLIQSLTNYYTCPKCGKVFRINFFKDIFIRPKDSRGKKLKCPSCHEVNFMRENSK